MKKDIIKKIISELRPHLKKYSAGHCFGSTTITNKDGTSTTVFHNGNTFEEQINAKKIQNDAKKIMCEIVEKNIKEKVYISPFTYSDIYFCKEKTNIILLAINSNGEEIKKQKRYG